MKVTSCSKCGSTEMIRDIPVVTSVDRISSAPVVVVAYHHPEATLLKGPVTHRMLAQVCGACGFTELYVENPKELLAMARNPEALE